MVRFIVVKVLVDTTGVSPSLLRVLVVAQLKPSKVQHIGVEFASAKHEKTAAPESAAKHIVSCVLIYFLYKSFYEKHKEDNSEECNWNKHNSSKNFEH